MSTLCMVYLFNTYFEICFLSESIYIYIYMIMYVNTHTLCTYFIPSILSNIGNMKVSFSDKWDWVCGSV